MSAEGEVRKVTSRGSAESRFDNKGKAGTGTLCETSHLSLLFEDELTDRDWETFILGVAAESDPDYIEVDNGISSKEENRIPKYEALYAAWATSQAMNPDNWARYDAASILKTNASKLSILKKKNSNSAAPGIDPPTPDAKKKIEEEFDIDVPTLLATTTKENYPEYAKKTLTNLVDRINTDEANESLIAVAFESLDQDTQTELIAEGFVSKDNVNSELVVLMLGQESDLLPGTYVYNTV